MILKMMQKLNTNDKKLKVQYFQFKSDEKDFYLDLIHWEEFIEYSSI